MEITNKKLQIKNKNLFIFSFLLLSTCYFLLATSALAWTIGEPIVPCGGLMADGVTQQPPCTQCELLHLLDNLIDFVLIAAAPILATLFFIIAGVYIMLGGSNPGMLATGKRIFSSTFVGILIVMLAWLITNTLIQTIADTSKVGNQGNWWNISCSNVGLQP